jgi:hypothetical protein
MSNKIRKQLRKALRSQNVFDLYDALADNGLDEKVHGRGYDAAALTSYIVRLLAVDDKARALREEPQLSEWRAAWV